MTNEQKKILQDIKDWGQGKPVEEKHFLTESVSEKDVRKDIEDWAKTKNNELKSR